MEAPGVLQWHQWPGIVETVMRACPDRWRIQSLDFSLILSHNLLSCALIVTYMGTQATSQRHARGMVNGTIGTMNVPRVSTCK